MVYVILMGAQGSGKGTQAAVIGPKLKLAKVATGELFRTAIADKTPLGMQVEEILARGELVPDDVTTEIVRARLADIVAQSTDVMGEVQGALFDGFPRNETQAESLDGILAELGVAVTVVIEIDVPRAALIERLAGRRTCVKSGRIVNIATMSPQELAEIDEPLIQRDDDHPDAVARRLELYDEKTAPLLTYYAERGLLKRVNGDQPVDDVSEEIARAIGERVQTDQVI
jgi:adenylate kinase